MRSQKFSDNGNRSWLVDESVGEYTCGMADQLILAIDAGTTGNRVLAFSNDQMIVADAYYEFPRTTPKPGWVEQDPDDIWSTTAQALKDVLHAVESENVRAIGITNQRETTILWDRATGAPVGNALVWQDRRTTDACAALAEHSADVKNRTGLFIDPYFSATKIAWLLDHHKDLRSRAENGEIAFGTVDSWLIWKLTGGRQHVTDPSNASRTLCYNIRTGEYDDTLLSLFNVPRAVLPEVRASDGDFGSTDAAITGCEIPICGVLGDQHAALFGQLGWEAGVVKNTYGTGLFMMASTGSSIPDSGQLINTVAWQLGDEVTYAIEGSVFIGGACVQWLRDGLEIVDTAAETEALAESLRDNDDVYFVPALAGMGAPYWDPTARGAIVGLTQGTTRAHLARAALEAIAFQTADLVNELQQATATAGFDRMRVDGGATANNFLMQFQADVTGLTIERPVITESTAFGAAALAGLSSGLWSREALVAGRRIDREFRPALGEAERQAAQARWASAVERALGWAR